MTTTPPVHADGDLDMLRAASEEAQRLLDHIKKTRAEQPALLAKARSDADEARGWALIEDPLANHLASISSIDGNVTLTLPNITAKELWGVRLAFDLLDCGEDYHRIDTVTSRLLSTVNGDTGIAMVIMAAALSTIAALVVPQMVDEIETRASNYEVRLMLAEARAKAWRGRVDELRQEHGNPDD